MAVSSLPFVCWATHTFSGDADRYRTRSCGLVRKYARVGYRRAGDITEPRNDFDDLLHPDAR